MDRIIALEHALLETAAEANRPPLTPDQAQTVTAICLEKLWDKGVVLEYSSRLVWQRLAALVAAGVAGFGLAHLAF